MAISLLLVAGVFKAADFVYWYPYRHTDGIDIPIGGREGWGLPVRQTFGRGDVVYTSAHPEDAISGVLVKDSGNFLNMRFELRGRGEISLEHEVDLAIVFKWESQEPIHAAVPGIAASIKARGGWTSVLLIRDNAGSNLWGLSGKEIRPTYVNRTYFDKTNQTITISFSKLLLSAAGWDGSEEVLFSGIVLRDGGARLSDYSGMGIISPPEWGGRTWLWNAKWVALNAKKVLEEDAGQN